MYIVPPDYVFYRMPGYTDAGNNLRPYGFNDISEVINFIKDKPIKRGTWGWKETKDSMNAMTHNKRCAYVHIVDNLYLFTDGDISFYHVNYLYLFIGPVPRLPFKLKRKSI